MKSKKILLVVFFLILFVFQQAQARANIQSNSDTLSPTGLLQGYNFPTKIWAKIYRLNQNGSRAPGDILCSSGDGNYGCVAENSGEVYPYDFNPQEVDVENDYLLDVVPREMPPQKYHEDAVYAQAIAARSFAHYIVILDGYVENSIADQVFVPYTFEYFVGPRYPDNPAAPCQSGNLTANQQAVCNALSSRYYIAPYGSNQPANTEFNSDMFGETQSGSETYLKSVQDPISTTCDSIDPFYGNNRGMSQEGASRWARGNQCAMEESGNEPWPVTWTDYRQILVHYYTGIDILNASGNKVAPDDRWNLLKHNVPSQMTGGIAQSVEIWLQNTSATEWNDARLVYQWVGTNNGGEVSLPVMPAGKDEKITVDIIPPASNGIYTLRLDVKRANGAWFSEQTPPWPDVQIPVTITGAIATSTPTPSVMTQTPTPTPICSLTPGADAYADCVVDFKANGSNNQWKDPNMVLGAPNCSPWNFLSLGGGGGYVIVDMGAGEEIVDGAGADLKIHETGSGCGGINERYDVFISNNPNGDWVPLNSGSGTSTFDLAGSQLFTVRYVMIVDNTGLNNSSRTPGADIDAIEALHSNASLTATPAPTLTPQPTATPKPCWCPLRFLAGLVCDETASSNASSAVVRVVSAVQEAAFDIQLFYRVRDEVLNQTPEGQRYIDLYMAHGTEISGLLQDNPGLAEEAITTLQVWGPNLQTLVDRNGNTVAITSEQVQTIQNFLDHLSALGSPALQQTIADERTRRPLEPAIDMNMNQAWNFLNGYQLQWLQPISNESPYPSQIGRTIPIQFTLADMQGNFVADPSVTIELADADGNVVVGPVGLSNNPATGIVIQGGKYHFNLQTKGLSAGQYTLRVYYNAVNPGQPYTWTINLVAGKK